MPKPVAELAADVRPLVKGVHLVHADAAQVLLVLLQHVQKPDRLAVGEREDEVGAGPDVRQDILGRRGRRQRARHR